MVLRTASASAAVTQATQPAACRPAANTVRTRKAPARADRAGAISRSIEAAPEAPTPARPPVAFDRRGRNAERSQLAADQVAADADLLRDIRKRAALLAHRHNRCDLVLEQRHPPCLLGRRQLAAVFQPARVAGSPSGCRASRALSLPESVAGPMPALPSGAVARGRARRERRALRTAGCGSAATRCRPNRRRFASSEAGLRATDARPRPHASRGKELTRSRQMA